MANFIASINEAWSIITVDHVRKFSAKARRYMLAYLHFHDKEIGSTDDNHHDVSYKEIVQFVKESKTHRNTADQETGYISRVWQMAISGDST